jgi:hypothetical protein
MITIALWVAAAGVVAVSLENFGAAWVLIGIAGLLVRFAYDRRTGIGRWAASFRMGPPLGLKFPKIS